MNINDLVGQAAERRVLISEEAVSLFADLVGDHNPLHLDPAAAAAGRFGAPVVHGMFLASLFSGILGEDLPGAGTIYLSQNFAFRRPIFVGQTVRVRIVVESVDADRRRVHLETTVFDSGDVPCVVGDAWVLIDAP